ncbi:MAG: CRTAC1 family protein [Candidatus Omnitrophica bacterium]|nr:CRTAC1 family protein [Candidatus Omnitrophota bacterium]
MDLGITFVHHSGVREKKDYIFETKGGGLLCVDLDGDDLPELYFVSATTLDLRETPESPRNALYKRQPDGSYKNIAKQSGVDDPGWGMGGCAGDIDNDGDTDFYITNFGENRLYINRGDGTFSEEARARSVDCPGMSTGSAFGDADGDGWLDLYVCNYIDWTWENIPQGPERYGNWRGLSVHAGPRGLPRAQDRFYHNRGDGFFEDWTQKNGVGKVQPQYGFQPVWFDADGDGDHDIFVANDSCPNYLFINDGKGMFNEDGFLRGVAYSNDGGEQGSMGVDLGDLNGDGLFDIVMTAWAQENNCLFLSQGLGFFQDFAFTAGFGSITTPCVGWGTVLFDYDNDGDQDLFFANGHVFPESNHPGLGTSYAQQDFLFENQGGFQFKNVTQDVGLTSSPARISRSATVGDLDGDGDLDLIVQNLNETPAVWLNEGGSQSNHWLRVRCQSTANCNPIGSTIEIHTGDAVQRRLISSGSSVFSQKELTAHFGLGDVDRVDKIIIKNNRLDDIIIKNVNADRLITVELKNQ